MSHRFSDNLYCHEPFPDDLPLPLSNAAQDPTIPPPSDESAFLTRLFDSEPGHMPHPDYLLRYRNRSVHLTFRQDSVKSILKVNAYYQFRPVTAFLSINYLDRFLSSHTLPEIGWPFQLLSVACLSLAAKMEELYIPSLLDLQLLEPTYVFEPKTVQRMELRVLATLKGRLRSVTPFDYLNFFILKFPCSAADPDSISAVESVASNLILNTTRVIDFLGFPPSVIAAAAVISAAGDRVDLPESFDERLNREMVRSCHQLMEEYLLDTCPSEGLKVISFEPLAPPSPIGVLDAAACVSCDTHPDNPAPITTSASGSGSGSGSGAEPGADLAEPENKRLRLSTSGLQEPEP